MSKDNEKKNWFVKHKILTVIGVLILIGLIASAANGNKSSTDAVTPSNSSKSSEPAKAADTPAAKPEEKKVSLMDFYDKVENGMTQAQVEALAVGIKPTSCSESQIQGLGTMKSCMYGGFFDKGTVSISYLNDSVNSKSKFNVD